jgi:hypothetical protein
VNPQPLPPELLSALAHKARIQEQWARLYGHIRPYMSAKQEKLDYVVSGGRIYYSGEGRRWPFVTDFLLDYVPILFGKGWWQSEVEKAEPERHTLVQWRIEAMKHMNKQPVPESGRRATLPNGHMAAYLAFAFNLFAIEDNSRFDSDLLHRLKNKEQFQGARHEVFAEATCLRAGFTIEHENERDRTHRHAEFTAKHKATGQLVSVEAKSKHRRGVLGQPGVAQPFEKLSLRFGTLLNEAIAKNPQHPLVVFIDTNLPTRAAERVLGLNPRDSTKPSPIMTALLDRDRKTHGGVDKYALLIFTNMPHHYAAPDELDPAGHTLQVMPLTLPGITHQQALHDLRWGASLYGVVPQEFPPL